MAKKIKTAEEIEKEIADYKQQLDYLRKQEEVELTVPRYPDTKRKGTDLMNYKQRAKGRVFGIFPWVSKKKPKRVLIEMNYASGKVSFFTVVPNDMKFRFMGKEYAVDEGRGKFCSNLGMLMYRYHENFSMPVSWDVASDELLEGVEDLEIRTSFNPAVLRDILKMEYTKGVIRGAEVSEMIKRAFILSILTFALVGVFFAVSAYKGGWI